MHAKSHNNKLRFLTTGLNQIFGMDAKKKKSSQMYSCLSQACLQMYEERKKLRETVPCSPEDRNFLDMIIQENNSLPEDKQWTADDISENIALIHLAGFDTTSLTFTTAMMNFVKDPQLFERLKELSDEVYQESPKDTANNYMEHSLLEEMTMEMLRLYSPTFFSTRRVLARNCKIAGINFRKNDYFIIPYALKHHTEHVFTQN